MLLTLSCQRNAEGCVMYDRFMIIIVSCGNSVMLHVSGSADFK
jgi:hypothetical protein